MGNLNLKHILNIMKLYIFGIICGGVSLLLSINFSFKLLALIIALLPVLIFIISSYLKNNGNINISNPFLLYSSFYFVFFGIGGILYDGDYYSKITFGCTATIMGVLGYSSGYLFSNLIVKRKDYTYESEPYQNGYSKSLVFEKFLFLIGFCGYVLYILQIGQIPILMNDLEQSRVDASTSGGAGFRIFAMFLILSSTIGFLNFSTYKYFGRKRPNFSMLRYLIAIILLFSLGNRSPIFNILFTSFLIYLFINYKGRIQLKKLLPLSILSLILVIAFVGGVGAFRVVNTETFHSFPEYRDFLIDKNYIGLSWFVFSHYLTIGFENLMRVFEVVPNIINYKLGISYIEPILTVLPGTQFTLDMQIKNALNQSYFGGGTVPSVLGEAFANFGYLGWFIVPFFSMLLLRTIYLIYEKSKKNLFYILLYAYLLNHFSNSLLSGLASSSIFPFITIFIYLYYGYYIRKKKQIGK